MTNEQARAEGRVEAFREAAAYCRKQFLLNTAEHIERLARASQVVEGPRVPRDMAAACGCGHCYGEHMHRSPFVCAHADCDCVEFFVRVATEPEAPSGEAVCGKWVGGDDNGFRPTWPAVQCRLSPSHAPPCGPTPPASVATGETGERCMDCDGLRPPPGADPLETCGACGKYTATVASHHPSAATPPSLQSARERALLLLGYKSCPPPTGHDAIAVEVVRAELKRLDDALAEAARERDVSLIDVEKWRDLWKKADDGREWAIAEQQAWFKSSQQHEADRDTWRTKAEALQVERDAQVGYRDKYCGERNKAREERDAALRDLTAARKLIDERTAELEALRVQEGQHPARRAVLEEVLQIMRDENLPFDGDGGGGVVPLSAVARACSKIRDLVDAPRQRASRSKGRAQ